jgi:hypothetical protein
VGAYKLAGAGATDDIANVLQDTLMGFGMKAQGATDAGRRFAGDEFGGVGPGKQGITAYHGSPHSFDRFSMDAIGTGEGAQAYGHGLYFAENEGVARGYRDALKMKGYDNNPIYNEAVSQHGFGAKEFDQFESLARQTIHDPDLLARAFFDWNDEWRPLASDPAEFKNVRDFAEKYIKSAPQGSMYEVNINANPDDFLDWDAPLSGQRAFESIKRDWDENLGDPDIILERLGIDPNTATGQAYLNQLAPNQGAAFSGVSNRLREQGIPGIKYRDAGSRGLDGDGTRNFVVFDENLIEIVKKYGIAGAAAMLGVSAADVEDAMNGS